MSRPGAPAVDALAAEGLRPAADRAREYAGALLDSCPVPAFVVAVTDARRLLCLITAGQADVAAGTPVTAGHRFEIGSISKVMNAVVVHQLIDEGRLDPDDVVVDRLPWVGLGEHGRDIRVRHLLDHSAGLITGSDDLPDERAMVWQLRDRPAGPPPGTAFHYSNVGYMLLGQLAEAASGRPLPRLLGERLFDPLGMSATSGRIHHGLRPGMAVGHWPARDDRPWAPGDELCAAPWFETATADGNIASTASDLAAFLRLLLSDGTVAGTRLLSPGGLRRLTEPHAPGGEDVLSIGGSPGATSSRYGLGVNVERIEGSTCLTHGGGMVGYASFVVADRGNGLGVAVLSNGNGEYPAAQLLCRVAHAAFREALAGRPLPALPDAELSVRPERTGSAMCGRFRGTGRDAGELSVEFHVAADGRLHAAASGSDGTVYRTFGSRFVTDNPQLRRYPLTFDPGEGAPRWCYGPFELLPAAVPTAAVPTVAVPTAVPSPYVGTYRSYSPWYPRFDVVERSGQLYLIAPGGVEAPDSDVELHELTPGTFRIGPQAWLPERLSFGPLVDGAPVWADRDGCRYSRAARD